MADQRTKQPRKILTEESYTSTLTHIVTRDYYPSLYSLRRDAAILDARSRGDVASAVAIRREARREEVQREKEAMEEAAEENEALEGENGGEGLVRKRPRLLRHESITGFHARVTSEDNAEFESNQEVESKQREMALGVIYSSAANKAGRLAIEAAVNGKALPDDSNNRALLGCETPLGLASDLYNASPSAGLRITDGNENNTKSGIGRNGLFFQPQHIDEKNDSQSGHLMLESAAAAPSTGNFLTLTNGDESTADNLLMPPPPARTSEALTLHPSQHSNKAPSNHLLNTYQLVEYQPKPLVPHINPPATRFPNQESRLSRTTNTNIHKRNQYTDGETSDATTDLDEVPPSLEDERVARRKAAIAECETFIPMTPLIHPGGGAAEEPIMTWGNVASTPLVLGGALDKKADNLADWEPTRPTVNANNVAPDNDRFDVVEENSRERLAHRAEKKLNDRSKTYRSAGSKALLDKVSRDNFDDASIASGTSSVATASTSEIDRSASLTPAARALLEASTQSIKSAKRSHLSVSKSSSRIFQPSPVSSRGASSIHAGSKNSFGSALRMAYTPSSTPSVVKKKRDGGAGKSSSSLSRRAAEGSTPRCHKF